MGLLAVHLNLERLDQIVRDNRGLGKTGETYTIVDFGNGFVHHYAFISSEGFGSDEFPDGIGQRQSQSLSQLSQYSCHRCLSLVGAA